MVCRKGMPKTVTPMVISLLKSRTALDTASKSGSSRPSTYSLLAANAKPLESAKFSSRFWMRPVGNGESDTWIGRAMTWFAPLPMALNSEKGKSGGRSTGCGVNSSRTMSRTSPEIRDTSATVGVVRGFLSQQRPNAVYECDTLLPPQFKRIRRAGGGKIPRRGNHHGLAVLRCALDLKRDIGDRGIGVVPRQAHRMIIERYRGQIVRGQKRRGVGLDADGNTLSTGAALRPDRAVRVIGARVRSRRASGESEKQHQRNEDRRNAENEDEPVHGNQDADCCGEASGLPGCEWAAPPTRVMNSRRLMGPPRPRITTQL